MKYKSISIPRPTPGVVLRGSTVEKDGSKKYGTLVQPNQALSLQEILERFTRGEPVDVGLGQPVYDDGPDDLSKIQNMDLVERDEFIDKQKATAAKYKAQEKRKKEAAEKAAHEKAVADALLELNKKGSQHDPGKVIP